MKTPELNITHTAHFSQPQVLRISKRTLDHYEFIYVINGQANFIYRTKEYSVSSGDLYFFQPGIVHSLISDEIGLKLVAVHFTLNKTRKPVLIKKDFPFQIKTPEPYLVEDLMVKIAREFNQKRPFFDLIIKSYLMNVLSVYLRQYQVLKQSRVKKGNYDFNQKRINQIIELIKKDIHRRISVSELAKEISVSSKYFSQLFKLKTNRSPVKFIYQIKMEKAKELLTHTDKPIKGIASVLGFEDVYYFSRRFKKIVGFPPGYFRRYYRDL